MNSPFNILGDATFGQPAGGAPPACGAAPPASAAAGAPGLGRRPEWLKVRLFGGENYQELRRILRTLELHTVCESARCPNQAECWEHRTATFMILGDVCTRSCGFCAVTSGRPAAAPDAGEPERVAAAAERMGLRYVVVTSVNRDDQPDGGSAIFADTIEAIRRRLAGAKVEVLIPDFRGDWQALETVLGAHPDVLNHNLETVPRLYRRVRPGAIYERSLELLARARQAAERQSGTGGALTVNTGAMPVKTGPRAVKTGPTAVKTGMMLGLGETRDEVLEVMGEVAARGVDILTLGQYLQPTREHLPVERYVPPEEFAEFKRLGQVMGLRHVESGPLVRSSYHAFEQERWARA